MSLIIHGYEITGGTTYHNIIKLSNDVLDTSFDPIVLSDDSSVYCMYRTNDDKVYFGGSFSTVNGQNYSGLARLNSDGTVDNTFIDLQNSDFFVVTIYQTTDNKIYLGGSSLGETDLTPTILIRLNSDGTLDTEFPTINGTTKYDQVSSILQTNDGKIYVAGGFPSFNGHSYNSIVRLNSNGILDTSFVDLNLNNNGITSMIQSNDEYIYVGGIYGGGGNDAQLVKLNSDGTLLTIYSTFSNFSIIKLYQTTDDKIYIANYGNPNAPTTTTYNYLARLNSDGTPDIEYIVSELTSKANDIIQSNNNNIYVATDDAITVLNSDGTFNNIVQDITNNAGNGYFYGIQELSYTGSTPTPSVTPTPTILPTTSNSTPLPISNSSNFRQLFRRYSDGALVVKDQIYDLMKGFQFQQTTPSTIWEICHNMQSDKFTQSIIVDDEVVNAKISIVDKCKILITFNTPTVGYVNIVFLDTTPSSEICHCTDLPSPTISVTPTITITNTPTPSTTTPPTPTPAATITPTPAIEF